MKIIVASRNPVKIQATQAAFEAAFPQTAIQFEGISVPSGVSDQPMTEEETFLGASNRAQAAWNQPSEIDFAVGIEGGLSEWDGALLAFAWVVIQGKQQMGKGRTASFFLPPKVATLIREGKELGEADDIVFGTQNSKQQQGAVGILTGNVITRTTLYIPAVTMALIPFLQPDHFPAKAK
ncbi:MAG: inosine/xanthosine triphosphatase [Bacteroidota bacterium]